ncbi:MAG: hypothetical protein ACOC3V_02240 [bacterium]
MFNTIKEFGRTMFIKVSGGIRTLEDIKSFLPYADRFGIRYAVVDKMNGLGSPNLDNY